MALERNISELFSPLQPSLVTASASLCNGHFFPLLIHAAKQISPPGQAFFQPEMLHMLLKQPQKPFSELPGWPKPGGLTLPAGVNQPETWRENSQENQVTPIKPCLYSRSGPHNLISSTQQKIQPLLKASHLFGGRRGGYGPERSLIPAAQSCAAVIPEEQPQLLPLLIYSPALNSSMANIYNKAANYGRG